jgi:hypothetical protein
MKRIFTYALAAAIAANAVVTAQGGDAEKVLADARAAMGGNKLAAVTSLAASGRVTRTGPDGSARENEFELTLQLPDKYLMRSVLAAMGPMSVYRNSGFNGGQLIEEIDQPPNLAAGNHIMVRIAGPGGTIDPDKMTPEQKAESDRLRVLTNKKDFTKLALGMFANSVPAYPVAFSYAGQAESQDGKADVIEVKGEGDFSARLFVDAQTHLPLMLSWMDKEPMMIQMTAGPGGGQAVKQFSAGGGGGTTTMRQFSSEGGKEMSKEDRDKMLKQMEEARKEAEAKPRRTVEYRVYYSDYKSVSGAMLPHQIQRSVDGKTVEEMVFDSFKVNPKIDAKTFQPTK